MKKRFLTIGLMVGITFYVPTKEAQAQCPNLNFASGTMKNWQCYAGTCSGGNYSIDSVLQIPGRHTIMDASKLVGSGQLYDENCNKIKKVPEGYNFSCRIGNSGIGSEVDAIEYEMTVDSNNALLILSHAWVMENPGHNPNEQPQFSMKIIDSAGKILPIPCSVLNGITKLACNTSTLVACDWTTVGYDLMSVIGRKIKIHFETWDCTCGGHFGYAYVVAECRPMRITVEWCEGSSVVRLLAPEGFQFYTWKRSGDPNWTSFNKNTNIANPDEGEIFTCTMKSELGCESTLSTEIHKTIINAAIWHGVKDETGHVDFKRHNWTSWYDTCSRTVTFVDKSQIFNSTKENTEWYIHGLGVSSSDSMFTYTFPEPIGGRTGEVCSKIDGLDRKWMCGYC